MIEHRKENNDFRLTGIVITYNEETARTSFGREKIMPGSFGNISDADVVLNLQHDRTQPLARTGKGGLKLIDSETELRAEVSMPSTRSARDAYDLVSREVLQGFSVEMIVTSERYVDEVRVITGAVLTGLGLVDRPAYQLSRAEVRKKRIPVWVY